MDQEKPKQLSAPALLGTLRSVFQKVVSPKKGRQGALSRICLMSGVSIFGMKIPSLLQFDQAKNEGIIRENLHKLYHVENAPCDTYLRERLDEIDPQALRRGFTKLFAQAQRGKTLEGYTMFNGHYLLSVDGTGHFSSSKVHCKNCCEKQRKNGSVTYYHQALAGAIVHPDQKSVLPICPEPILKQDGVKKNDCERNASKRLLRRFRREHPHLKTIILEDALAANAPHIQELKQLNLSYIIGVKPIGNACRLFTHLEQVEPFDVQHSGKEFSFRFVNQVPLNGSTDIKVNVLECVEMDRKGQLRTFSWVTDLLIDCTNVYLIMRAGRSRWKIENETFNTLKNQGYHFEHNYGHGKKNLSTVLLFLMMMAFLVDQIQQSGCELFQKAKTKTVTKVYLWHKMKSLFNCYYIKSWTDLYSAIAFGYQSRDLAPNSS